MNVSIGSAVKVIRMAVFFGVEMGGVENNEVGNRLYREYTNPFMIG